ncbi:MAG: molybdopterin molybdenumtransferase MoeA [Candidatus Binatia bacterium]|nr:MAG: molybdopterin molybdenumtransferase MoeA [Candidatus Binatia bacterium]
MPRAHEIPKLRSFFRVVTTEEARGHLGRFPPLPGEKVRVQRAFRRVLAEDLFAPEDLPHFARANMDGYAVHAADTFGASPSQPAYLRLVGSVPMGRAVRRELERGEAVRISTGGMLPPGADAVVMLEYVDELPDSTVEVQRSVSPWENVVRVGEDIARGKLVFRRGRRLRARDLGALTGLGILEVPVHRRPRVALVSTGDEIVSPSRKPKPGQVRNVNEFSLRAMAEEAGGIVRSFGVVPDDADKLRHTLARALEFADAVLLSGGSSVGTKDIALDVITSFPDSEVLFHGISIAPGKPTILCRALGKPVLGLPGHPVSALVIFELFGAPLLRLLQGERPEEAFAPDRTVRAVLGQNVASQPGREDYVRVRLERQDGRLRAVPIPAKSAAVFSLVQADGLVRVPASAEGLESGTEVEVRLL